MRSIASFRNSLDFFLRNHLTLTRRGYHEKGLALTDIEPKLNPSDANRIKQLCHQYRLEEYLPFLEMRSFLDNCMHLWILDSLRPFIKQKNLHHVLDIGSKNFSYAVGIFEFIKHINDGEAPRTTGIELDANRLYTNLYTRHECANYYTSLIPEASFKGGDFLSEDFEAPFDLVINFFPFVLLDSLLDWGLPRRCFNPTAMFSKCHRILKEEGLLVLSYTDEEEYLAGQIILENCQFKEMGHIVIETGLTPKPMFASIYEKKTSLL